MSPVRLRALYLALAAFVVLLDQATKKMVQAWVPLYDRIVVIPGFFDITHVENTGAAFGLFAGATSPYRPLLLNTVAFAVFLFVLVYAFRSPVHWKRLQLALAGILGGAIGNLIDRVGAGAVTDFLRVHAADRWEWPSFNVADSAITVGVVLLALDIWKNPESEETKPES
ncbi:MAG TPA: signal peptidase II [Thermoanaerobaculia bacterium]|nr:signal peptidase II [Thermoanaerobaculia bacterium]HQN06318.1 signal peptidase II [Thermoanaerobaculia bacterium]HQP85214.1 signal peptidase II [Thermoanaerobaculia bacterium]